MVAKKLAKRLTIFWSSLTVMLLRDKAMGKQEDDLKFLIKDQK